MSNWNTLLVPVDFSPQSRAAFDAALQLAADGGGKLVLVHAMHLPSDLRLTGEWWATLRAAATRGIGELCEAADSRGVEVDSEIVSEHPVDAICRLAAERSADVIVMGSHGHGALHHALLGSVAARVLATAPCPVLTIKHDPSGDAKPVRFQTIVVPTDFSPAADAALRYACSLAASGARVHLVHAYHVEIPVLSPSGMALPATFLDEMREFAQQRLNERAAEAEKSGVEVTSELAIEPAAGAAIDAATRENADVVVMGTRGLTGIKHVLLGSVAERTVRLAPCPVLTIGA